jgi:hypothetical protein
MSADHYQRHWLNLFERRDGEIVPATDDDQELARSYLGFSGKGSIYNGCRVTILTTRHALAVGETLRVLHVVEFVEPGHVAYIVGPKPVYDEYVDDAIATAASPHGEALAPLEYNGRTLPSPVVDYNYEITTYRFDRPGVYEVQWRPGDMRSNILTIKVAGGTP